MKRLIYQVYVGAPSRLYDKCIESVAAYCVDHGIDHVVQEVPKLFIRPDPFMTNRSAEAVNRLGYLPIYEKENAFEYLNQYDEIGVIDSDIYIRRGSPNIFDDFRPDFAFGAVAEREMPLTPEYQRKILGYSNMQYQTLHRPPMVDFVPNSMGYEFFNMGLMMFRKSIIPYLRGETPKQFIHRPEFKQFVDGLGAWKWSTDQTLLNYWLKSEKIPTDHLSWKWNGLYTANTRIKECNFVHFFLKDKLPNRGEDVDVLLRRI